MSQDAATALLHVAWEGDCPPNQEPPQVFLIGTTTSASPARHVKTEIVPPVSYGQRAWTTQGNSLGQYYCWNRTYDINTGRWTTPDPVATPWWNLWDYVGAFSTQRCDHTGNAGAAAVGAAVVAGLKSLGLHAAKCLAVAAGTATATAIVVNIVSAPGAMDPCKMACVAGIMAFAGCIAPWGSGIIVGAIIDVMLGHPVEAFCEDVCAKLRASGSTSPSPGSSSSGGSGTSVLRRDRWGKSDGETACVTPEEIEDLKRIAEEERREYDRKNGIIRDSEGREIARKDQQA